MAQQVSELRTAANGISIRNGGFETVPTFTAATTTINKWIDGTSTGSAAIDSAYGWGTYFIGGTASAQFDTSTFKYGSASLKLSTSAIASQVVVAPWFTNTQANIGRHLYPIKPSTAYTVTYWMKTNLTSGSANGGCYLRARTWQNSSTVTATNLGTSVKTTVDWTKYSITFTSTSVSSYVSLEPTIIGSDGTATLIIDAWFDDIRLFENTAVRTAVA